METTQNNGCLTPREREIAALIAQGLTTRSISITLRLKYGTVAKHRDSICRKLDGRTAEITRYAIREGLIAP